MTKIRKWLGKTKLGLDVMETVINVRSLLELQQDEYIRKNLLENPAYRDSEKLNKFEKKYFSQNGEDGILEEIFRRIGTTNQNFVEFGVGNGTENNTAFLLLKGWKGTWLEGSPEFCDSIRQSFQSVITTGQLNLVNTFITKENIVGTFEGQNIPRELDLLSIDIDGNDYWIWKELDKYRARVVVIEYNAHFPPHLSWVKSYDGGSRWDGTTNMGASLRSMTDLGREKGYTLVACDFVGVNAFFVRNDLLGDRFPAENTAEFHYENPKIFLLRKAGHPRGFTAFETR